MLPTGSRCSLLAVEHFQVVLIACTQRNSFEWMVRKQDITRKPLPVRTKPWKRDLGRRALCYSITGSIAESEWVPVHQNTFNWLLLLPTSLLRELEAFIGRLQKNTLSAVQVQMVWNNNFLLNWNTRFHIIYRNTLFTGYNSRRKITFDLHISTVSKYFML